MLNGTLGSMLQGVSQQTYRVRPLGKVTEQKNFISDFVRGLTSRPACSDIEWLGAITPGTRYLRAEIGDSLYFAGYSTGVIRVWDIAGVEYPVDVQDADAAAYLGSDMSGYVYDDTLYITNRDLPVQALSTIDTSGVLLGVCLAYCLGGLFSRTYTLTVRYQSGVSIVGTYTTPDGDLAGDAAKTEASYIIEQLRLSLLAAPGLAVGTTVVRVEGTILIQHSLPLTATADDGETGDSLRVHASTARSIEDLSKYAPHGAFVVVTGSDAGKADDFYLRFVSATTTTLGAGFGTVGVWEECADLREALMLDAETMPHVLRLDAGTFYFERAAWQPRRAGDADSNPLPNFVGRRIRDISGMDSRLAFVAGSRYHGSRSNIPTDFFKQSALGEFDTDPIDLQSTKEGKSSLDWIIPFDRDLILLSDPGAAQFVVTGGTKLTPANASLQLTTSFEIKGKCKPVKTGKTIVFPFESGMYSGINEFFAQDALAVNGVETITSTTDRYIPGAIDHLDCSNNFNTIVATTTAPATANTLWVYKYLWQNEDKAQSSLSHWTFPGDVEFTFFDNSQMYLVLRHADGCSLNVLDLDAPVSDITSYHVCLDRGALSVVDEFSAVTLPMAGLSFVQGTDCEDVGREVLPTSETVDGTDVVYTFAPETVPAGATLIHGYKFNRSLKPTMPVVRERDGSVSSKYELVVSDFQVFFDKSGDFSSTMTSPYRQPQTQEFDWFPLDDDPLDPLSLGVRGGDVSVSWGERADWSSLELHSDSVRPTTFIEVRWNGERL